MFDLGDFRKKTSSKRSRHLSGAETGSYMLAAGVGVVFIAGIWAMFKA